MPRQATKLDGDWTLSALEIDGRAMPVAGGIEIKAGRFRAIGMGADYAGSVEVDDTAVPAQIDLVFGEGPEAGNRNRGIYEIDGETLRICLNMMGKARPASFATPPGSGNALEVFRRGAAVAAAPVVTEASGEGELVGEWEMVNAWQDGHALDARMVKTGRRVTTATHTTTYFGKQVYRNSAYTADPNARPKTIDFHGLNPQLGIYEVEGDVQRVCFGAPGQPRPADFESKPGDGRTVAVWRRVASAKAANPKTAGA